MDLKMVRNMSSVTAITTTDCTPDYYGTWPENARITCKYPTTLGDSG